jgi:hypothetical protein
MCVLIIVEPFVNAFDEICRESRMRENRTYGLMRGRENGLAHFSLYSTVTVIKSYFTKAQKESTKGHKDNEYDTHYFQFRQNRSEL